MLESPLAKKLKRKPGLKAAVISVPETYVDTRKRDTALSPTLNGKFDWIQIFARNKAELEPLPRKRPGHCSRNPYYGPRSPKAARRSRQTSPVTRAGRACRHWI